MRFKDSNNRSRWVLAGTLVVTAFTVAWGAQNQGARAASQDGTDDSVASVGGLSVENEELLAASTAQLEGVELEKLQCETTAQKRRYDVLSFNLERLVRDRLAELGAQKAGLEKAAYLEREGKARREAVTTEAVDNFIASNQRLARTPREQIAPQVRAFLADNALYKDLEKQFPVDRKLEPYRVPIDTGGAIHRGGENATVEVVEFSDFQCPYCKQVTPALDQMIDKYGDKVKLVFRQFPLESIHPNAFKAAQGALCAGDQGKFWEMHDLMFEEQRKLAVENLKEKAERLGLDKTTFAQCLDSSKYATRVRADLKAGALAGVTGTPALFINGRPFSGNRNLAGLSQVIDEELETTGR